MIFFVVFILGWIVIEDDDTEEDEEDDEDANEYPNVPVMAIADPRRVYRSIGSSKIIADRIISRTRLTVFRTDAVTAPKPAVTSNATSL